jgi:multidrug efflux pump subunit AcrA (membrane-fusion protein)
LVCELDSASYRDEVIAQQIRADDAKARMIQARSILAVNEISLQEYRDGIYLQDLQLIRQYVTACRTEEERARRNLNWSTDVYEKGFRARTQYLADILSLERAEIALAEALRMERRLIDYTGPKLIKSLEAKLEANRADALAQESAFQLESDRLKRLQRMVENCTLKAPQEGIVVYSMPPPGGWRAPTPVIYEGATVRQGQAIFELPDAKKMRVRAKVNESRVNFIKPGQKASIRIDAFPDRELIGTVTEVTAIPAPNGIGSDVKVYFANVMIDQGGFEGLRPGLSAQVLFFIDAHPEVVKIPIPAVRWVDDRPYAAVTTSSDRTRWRWQPLELGLMNENFAEVTKGLKVGEKVVARPEDLSPPTPDTAPVLQAGGTPGSPQG